MNQVLAEIMRTGLTKTADGNGSIKVHSAISKDEGEFLQRCVREVAPAVSLEIGLAHGISALFICDALRPEARHIIIDPNQHDSWDGIGLANLTRAGFGNQIHLIEKPSYQALAQLEVTGQRIDFAFIDGWHTFDFTLVDFFYIDRMLNVGGIVAFDDANWPAVRKVCRFVNSNLSYSVFGVEGSDEKPRMKHRLLKQLLNRRPFRSMLRPEIIYSNEGLAGSCIAFRKTEDDTRRWDHYRDF